MGRDFKFRPTVNGSPVALQSEIPAGGSGNVVSQPAAIVVFVQNATPSSPQKGDIWIKVQAGEDAI